MAEPDGQKTLSSSTLLVRYYLRGLYLCIKAGTNTKLIKMVLLHSAKPLSMGLREQSEGNTYQPES